MKLVVHQWLSEIDSNAQAYKVSHCEPGLRENQAFFILPLYIDFLVYTLKVLEACVKNCGAPMHKEVATKEIMDFFRELAKVGIKLKTIKIMFESNTNNFLQSSKTGLTLSCHLHQ